MSRRPYGGFNTRQTSQSRPIPGSTQVENSAGGFSWQVDKWQRLERFLILGAEGGTYYIKEQKLVEENAQALVECTAEDGRRVVSTIINIRAANRNIKQDPVLFAWAYVMAHGDVEARRAAARSLPEVARTGRQLFTFCEYALQFRSWGPILCRAVANWYLMKDENELAYQLVKYRQGGGFTHKRLLNVAHPDPTETGLETCLRWAHGDAMSDGEIHYALPRIIEGYELAKKAEDASSQEAADIVRVYGLTWEMVPTDWLSVPHVWEALLEHMPVMATIRQLPKMTSIGLLSKWKPETCDMVVERLKGVKGAGVHPLQVLFAMRTYADGHGYKGKLTWEPVPEIISALDSAFYTAFGNVEPTGKTIVIGLDVSGSMSGYNSQIVGTNISAREASVAMAMVTAAVEKRVVVVAFSHRLEQLKFVKGASLEQVTGDTAMIPFGGTDCALPMLEATAQGVPVDAFITYTDNETWAGRIHPSQALREHRERLSPKAKSIVVAMTSNGFTIADPNDPGMLDVVGFDTSVPQAMSDFISS